MCNMLIDLFSIACYNSFWGDTMPTEAKKAGNARHVAKLDVIKIQPYKDEGAAIRTAATNAGQSLQAYVLQAIRERMFRESSGNFLPILPDDATRIYMKASNESVFSWDYGLSYEDRERQLEKDKKRFMELCAIREERSLSQEERMEFMYLLTIHKEA